MLDGTNLAVLNLHVYPILSHQVSAIYHSRADVVSRFSSWPPWWPSWILELNEFSNSISPCHPNASQQVWAQSDLPFGSRRCLKIFKMATVVAILDHLGYWNYWNLFFALMPPIKFQLNLTYGMGGDVV